MKLYDAYGREVDTAYLRDEQAAPTMAGVRNIYSVMHPSVGLTPEKLIAIQREAEAGDPYLYLELAEEMEEKDLHYLAVISTRKQAIAGAELIVTPASEAAEDLRAADLVQRLRRWWRVRPRERAVRYPRRGRQGFFGDRDHLGHQRPRMDPQAPDVARPALVHVRLDFGRGTAGAHAAR